MKNYQQGRVQPIENNFVVEWTMTGSDGKAVSQVRPLADSGVAFAAPDDAGNLQIEAVIKDRGQVIARQNADPVAVATYTPVPTPTPEFTPTPTPSPTPEFAEVTANANANVRSGPGTAYGKIGTLSSGATYRVTGQNEEGGWWQISFDGKQGWISGNVAAVSGNTKTVAVVIVAPPPTAAPVAAVAVQPAQRPVAGSERGGSFAYGVQVDPNGGHMNQIPPLGIIGSSSRYRGRNSRAARAPRASLMAG